MNIDIKVLLGIINFIGSCALFLFGMKLLSEGINKSSSSKLKNWLRRMTKNRFTGFSAGLLLTTVNQSSTVTTVLIVSLVNAGLVTLSQSVSVIMGANTGAALIVGIITLAGFVFKITWLPLPLIAVSILFYWYKNDNKRNAAEILTGLGLLLLGIQLMNSSLTGESSKNLFAGAGTIILYYNPLWIILFILIGAAVTIVLKSSISAIMAAIALAANGRMAWDLACAFVLGANIGITITSLLSSQPMNVHAGRAARVHMLFNLFGVIWTLVFFKFFLKLADFIIPGDVLTPLNLPAHIAAFLLLFYLVNSCLLIGFVKQIVFIVEKMLPVKTPPGEPISRFPFIPVSIPGSRESNLITMRVKIGEMGLLVQKMLLSILNATVESRENLAVLKEKMHSAEETTDILKDNLTKILQQCITDANTKQTRQIWAMQRIVNQQEAIADSCFRVAILMERQKRKGFQFHQAGVKQIQDFASFVLDFLQYNNNYITFNLETYNFEKAVELEKEINRQRNILKKFSRRKIEQGADVQGQLVFIDIIKHLEHVGDYCLNVSEAIKEIDQVF